MLEVVGNVLSFLAEYGVRQEHVAGVVATAMIFVGWRLLKLAGTGVYRGSKAVAAWANPAPGELFAAISTELDGPVTVKDEAITETGYGELKTARLVITFVDGNYGANLRRVSPVVQRDWDLLADLRPSEVHNLTTRVRKIITSIQKKNAEAHAELSLRLLTDPLAQPKGSASYGKKA